MPIFTPFSFRNVKPAASYVTSGLLAYWDANNASSYSGTGTTWYDLSGNSRNLTIVGSPTFTSGTPSYFDFGGSTSKYCRVADAALSEITENNEYSWFTAVYVTNFTFNVIFGNNRTANGGFRLKAQAFGGATGNRLSYQPWDQSSNAYNCYAGSTYNATDTWYVNGGYHSWTATNGPCDMYVNAGAATTTNTSTSKPTFTETYFYLGGDSSNALSGRVGMCMLYNKKLSSAEFTQNFDFFKSTYGY